MPDRYQLIYLSHLAPEETADCVSQIVRTARQRNPALGVGGLLIFDGGRFCQYIEGGAEIVGTLAEQIRMDTRHVNFQVLYQSHFAGPYLLAERGLEYALCYDDCLDRFEDVFDASAIALLHDLRPRLDMEPKRQTA
ncbi:MAG TPA: BLUF domain-containing protein [Thiobacillus sp.]